MRKLTAHEKTKAAEHYRDTLLAKKAELLSSLGVQFDTLARMGRVAEEDQAQITHDEFISLHLNSMDYETLRDVNEALERLDSGEYGICLNCDGPIAIKRLDALPWAKYCLDCQAQLATLVAEDSPVFAGASSMRSW